MSDVDPILNQSRRFQKFRNTLIRIIPRIPNDRVSLQATSMSSQAAMASASDTTYQMNAVVRGMVGKRLTYRDLIAVAG